jgi:hypothetical protein
MFITSSFTTHRPNTNQKPASQHGGPVFSGNRDLDAAKKLEGFCRTAGISQDQLNKLENERCKLPRKENTDPESLRKLRSGNPQIVRREQSRLSQIIYRERIKYYLAALQEALKRKKPGSDISDDMIKDIIQQINPIKQAAAGGSRSNRDTHFEPSDCDMANPETQLNPFQKAQLLVEEYQNLLQEKFDCSKSGTGTHGEKFTTPEDAPVSDVFLLDLLQEKVCELDSETQMSWQA